MASGFALRPFRVNTIGAAHALMADGCLSECLTRPPLTLVLLTLTLTLARTLTPTPRYLLTLTLTLARTAPQPLDTSPVPCGRRGADRALAAAALRCSADARSSLVRVWLGRG